MFSQFFNFRGNWIDLIIILVFLFLVLEGWLAFQVWQLEKRINSSHLELRQKIEQIQNNVNYSSSLLWMMNGR